jgi:hypothetical protein
MKRLSKARKAALKRKRRRIAFSFRFGKGLYNGNFKGRRVRL